MATCRICRAPYESWRVCNRGDCHDGRLASAEQPLPPVPRVCYREWEHDGQGYVTERHVCAVTGPCNGYPRRAARRERAKRDTDRLVIFLGGVFIGALGFAGLLSIVAIIIRRLYD